MSMKLPEREKINWPYVLRGLTRVIVIISVGSFLPVMLSYFGILGLIELISSSWLIAELYIDFIYFGAFYSAAYHMPSGRLVNMICVALIWWSIATLIGLIMGAGSVSGVLYSLISTFGWMLASCGVAGIVTKKPSVDPRF